MRKKNKQVKRFTGKCLTSIKSNESNKDTQYWSEIDAIYNTVSSSLLEIGITFQKSLVLLEKAGMGNDEELLISTKGFYNDLDMCVKELNEVKEEHKDKVGPIIDIDDFALSVKIFQNYSAIFNKFNILAQFSKLMLSDKMSQIDLSKLEEVKEKESVND